MKAEPRHYSHLYKLRLKKKAHKHEKTAGKFMRLGNIITASTGKAE